MTQVLDATAHERLEKAYGRMYKRLRKMRFRELGGGEREVEKGTGGGEGAGGE
jgi:hypothetical protein